MQRRATVANELNASSQPAKPENLKFRQYETDKNSRRRRYSAANDRFGPVHSNAGIVLLAAGGLIIALTARRRRKA